MFNILGKIGRAIWSGTEGLAAYRAAGRESVNILKQFATDRISTQNLRYIYSGVGTSSMSRRVGLAGTFLGGSLLTGKIIENREQQLRAYYGNEYYDMEFKNAASGLTKGVMFGGMALGFQAAIGKDPISRTLNSFSLRFGKGRSYGSLLKGSGSNIDNLDIITKKIDAQKNEIARLKNIDKTKLKPEKLARIEKIIEGRNKAVNVLQRVRSNAAMAYRTPRLDILHPFQQMISGKESLPYAGARFAGGLGRVSMYTGMLGFTGFSEGPVVPTIGIAGMTVGMGAAITRSFIKNPFKKGFTASPELAKGIVKESTEVASSGFLGKLASSTLVGAVGAVGGAYLGSKMTDNVTGFAEGDITSFNQRSMTQKMNYSTAGLVQALHNNNRRF